MIDDVFAEVRLRDGGANGSIIGRNPFQLPKVRALGLTAAQDAGKVGLGAGIIADVVGDDLVDMAVHCHHNVPPGDGVSPF